MAAAIIRRGPAPIVVLCPCGAGLTSRYAAKTHICPPPRITTPEDGLRITAPEAGLTIHTRKV